MAVMPGAIYRPISKSRARRKKGRGIVLHVAVSEAASLYGFFSGVESDSHFYVRRDGTIEQYVDTDLVSYASAAGNPTLISVETQGGLTNADAEPWTPAQVSALTRLVAWAALEDGFPLQAMPDSRPASRGVGYHRLGVKPWVVSGGEVWSSSNGKRCPGDAKIAQIPKIISAAAGSPSAATTVQEDDMPGLLPNENEALNEIRGNMQNVARVLPTLAAESQATNQAVGRLDTAINDRTSGVLVQVARLSGVVAGLATTVTQLDGGDGLDLAEINAVAQAAATAAIRDLGVSLAGAK